MAKPSTNKITIKRKITQKVLDLLPGKSSVDLERALRTWYYNLRSTGGLRLTSTGYMAMKSAALNSWSVDLSVRDLTKVRLLILDREIDWPYYIDARAKKLIMFSSRDAMMATLYGDVKSWLDSLVP